jgi:hypothetical protein
MILDIHTHREAPQPEAVVSVDPLDFDPVAEQLYSVGIHPWNTAEAPTEEMWRRLETAVRSDSVVTIGECGIDTLKGGPMFRQLTVMKRQIDLSERIGKPLIIHDVKAHDIITGLRRDLKPRQPWIIHGFRGKPQLASMLTAAGCFISFGEKFNPETVRSVSKEWILAETDESALSIEDIIRRLEEARGEPLLEIIAGNTDRILFHTSPIQ